MRKVVFLFAVGLSIATIAPPAGAITGGDPDGAAHPNVGAFVGTIDGGESYYFVCSASLLGDHEVLTAAHCTLWETLGLTEANVFVTFDQDLRAPDEVSWGFFGPVVEPELLIPVVGKDVMPGFWLPPSGAQSRNDVAVVRLAEPASATYPGIEPVELPQPGYLTDAARRGGLVGQELVNVGYGFQSLSFVNPTTPIAFNGLRMVSTSPVVGLTKDHVTMLQNASAGAGGICVGDSGGPNFLGPAGSPEGNLQLSLNVGQGYHDCGVGITTSQRLDLPAVHTFLSEWTPAP